MSAPPRIVGIVLVRNEDLHIERVLRNVVAFCDVIHVADHRSTDDTPAILAKLAAEFPQIEMRRIADPRESNALLVPYVDTPTWVFGIDGDEIYDPAGLAALRAVLFAGRYDAWWVVFGNVLNCVEIDLAARTASGYLAPPCRSMTKLYNFRMLRELDPAAPQRLHSHQGRDIFHEPYHALLRYDLYKETRWEDARFRCLHTCFLPRSSLDPAGTARENVSESLQPLRRLQRFARTLLGRGSASDYKRDKYMRGPKVTVDATPFFPVIDLDQFKMNPVEEAILGRLVRAAAPKTIAEFGCGLSTRFWAQQSEARIVAWDNFPDWVAEIRALFKDEPWLPRVDFRLYTVTPEGARDVEKDAVPWDGAKFDFLFLDGPRSAHPPNFGRSGTFRFATQHAAEGATIVWHDAQRPHEREMARHYLGHCARHREGSVGWCRWETPRGGLRQWLNRLNPFA